MGAWGESSENMEEEISANTFLKLAHNIKRYEAGYGSRESQRNRVGSQERVFQGVTFFELSLE